MNRFVVASLALVALVATAACTPSTLKLDSSFEGLTVRAARGEFVSLALPSHPDSDPGWVATVLDRARLRPEGPPVYIARDDVPGAPGVSLFRYRVMADGEIYLSLQYLPGEFGLALEDDDFSVKLNVSGPARHFP